MATRDMSGWGWVCEPAKAADVRAGAARRAGAAAKAARHPTAPSGPNRSLHIALLDDDREARHTARRMLEAQGDGWTLGLYANLAHVLATRTTQPAPAVPHIALAAISAPLLPGLGLIHALKAVWPAARIITLLEPAQAQLAWPALLAEADGCLVKPLARHDLAGMIELAARGAPAFCPDSWAVITAEGRRAISALTPGTNSPAAGAGLCALDAREEQILACLEEGLLYKEITDRLNLSHSLLRKLQRRIYAKLDAENRAEALRHWHSLKPDA